MSVSAEAAAVLRAADPDGGPASSPGRRSVLRRLLHRPAGVVGLLLTGVVGAVAVLAGVLASGDPFATGHAALQAPSAVHLFGTDNLGRDLFGAVVHGVRTSMTVVVCVTALSAIIGISLGAVAGYVGGIVDHAVLRLTELVQTIPRFFLALLVLTLFGSSQRNLVLLLGLTSWTLLARVVRAETMSLRNREYVEAARSYGASTLRILVRHVVPNVLPAAAVVLSLNASRIVLLEAGLAFLGVSDPDRMSLGFLVNNAQQFLQQAWWMSIFPGVAIMIAVLGINLLADVLDDVLSPVLRRDLVTPGSASRTAQVQGPAEAGTGVGPAPLLSVRDLHVSFRTDAGTVRAVDGVSFDLFPHEVLGVVGESGCGKTATALAVLDLLPATATVTGQVRLREQDLLALPPEQLRRLRGTGVAMVFQDSLSALNPVHRVGRQVAEAVLVHHPDAGRRRAAARAVELLDLVGLPDPRAASRAFPHELSGGMRQRVLIAVAIANDPDVLIADEPTTALDVTTQAQVLEVLERVRARTGAAMLLITHDLGVVAGTADRVLVMREGRVVESGTVDDVLLRPTHPYTVGLLGALVRPDAQAGR